MNNTFTLNKTTIAVVFLALGLMFVASFSYRLSNPSLIKRVTERQTNETNFGTQGMNTGMTQELMAHIGELMSKLGQDPNNFEVRVELAEHFMEAQDWASAEVHLAKALAVKPDDVAANYSLGVVQYQQGKFAESAATFEKVVSFDEDSSAKFNLAILYYQHLGKKDEAVALFKSIASSEASDPELKSRATAILDSLK